MKRIKLFEQYNQSIIDCILLKIEKQGVEELTLNELNVLKNTDVPIKEIDISFTEFKHSFQPKYNNNPLLPFDKNEAERYFWDYFVIEDIKTLQEISNSNPYSIWSILNGKGKNLHITNGFYRIDAVGYIVTENTWVQGNNYWIKF